MLDRTQQARRHHEPDSPLPSDRGRPRRSLLKSAALFTVAALSLGSGATIASLALVPQSALAATYGAGYNDASSGSVFGNFVLPDGSKGYCIDPGAAVPTGHTSDSGVTGDVTSVGSGGSHAQTLTAAELASINAIVSRHGQTDDNNVAAAVALTVWGIANPAAFAEETNPHGDNYKMTLAPSAQRAAIAALTAQFRAEATAYSAPNSVNGSASMHLEMDANNNYEGTLVIDALTTSGTGSITLTNGAFLSTDAATVEGSFSAGTRLPFRASVPDGQAAGYSVSAELSLSAGHSTMPAANLHLWVTGSSQKLVSTGGTVTTVMKANTSDSHPRSALFNPVATTRAVSVWLHKGDELVDSIQPSTAPNAAGLNNPWPLSGPGNYLPVVYKNVAYGPFAVKPTLSRAVPVNSPVAATARFTTEKTGPTIAYETRMSAVSASGTAQSSGYYTFVVSVDYADQTDRTKSFLAGPLGTPPAAPYTWTDFFAHHDETVFTLPTVTTAAQPLTAALGTVADRVIVDGPVPAEGLDVTFAGYLQPVGSTAPVCTAASRVFASSSPTLVDRPGTYESENFAVPSGLIGTLYWVATTVVRTTHTIAQTGRCGDLTEQTIVAPPTVTTTPPSSVVSGSTAHDVVTVTGWVPVGTTTSVSLFKQASGSQSLSCSAGELVTTLSQLTLSAGLNNSSTSVTAETGALPAGKYGFVQTTYDRDRGVVSTSGCHDELFTVIPATPLATTGTGQLEGAAFGGSAGGLLLATGAAFVLTGSLRRRRTQP